MILQQTMCREIERLKKDQEFSEIAKKVPWSCTSDKELDENQKNEDITEIEQMGKCEQSKGSLF